MLVLRLADLPERVVEIDRLLARLAPEEEHDARDAESDEHPRSPLQRVAGVGIERCINDRRQDDDADQGDEVLHDRALVRLLIVEVTKRREEDEDEGDSRGEADEEAEEA